MALRRGARSVLRALTGHGAGAGGLRRRRLGQAALLRQLADSDADKLADALTNLDSLDTSRIEEARARLEQDPTALPAPFKKGTVGEMAASSSSPRHKGLLLHALVAEWAPGRVLEMGTCCGVSGAYIGSARPGSFTSLEFSPILADTARRLWLELGVAGEVRVGDFADTFAAALEPAPDLVFVDGNHAEGPTWDYFEKLAKVCPPGALLVFDDIGWSDGMRSVWTRIQDDPRARVTADVGTCGLVIL